MPRKKMEWNIRRVHRMASTLTIQTSFRRRISPRTKTIDQFFKRTWKETSKGVRKQLSHSKSNCNGQTSLARWVLKAPCLLALRWKQLTEWCLQKVAEGSFTMARSAQRKAWLWSRACYLGVRLPSTLSLMIRANHLRKCSEQLQLIGKGQLIGLEPFKSPQGRNLRRNPQQSRF